VSIPGPSDKGPGTRNVLSPSGYARRGLISQHLASKWLKTSQPCIAQLIVTKKAKIDPNGVFPQGRLRAGSLTLPCAIGRTGIRHSKREGDGATPVGRWPLLFGFYRADRLARPKAYAQFDALDQGLGWCDDAASPAYNRPVRLPFAPSHEDMWREDGLYDLVIVLGQNLKVRHKGGGSAIFLHCARPEFSPTAGCVALRPQDFRRLLPRLSKKTVLIVR